MNTETYEKLLSELGISDGSLEDRVAVLEKECNDASELLNVVQPRGDTEKINQLKERMKELGAAIDYTEKLQKSLSSGLVFDTQNEKDRLEELKEAGKEKAQTVRELADVTQPISNSSTGQSGLNSPAGQSATQQPVSASSSTQSKMRRAKMELEDGSWEKAEKLYEDILNEEPENAEANLGLFMASQQIRGKKQIPETARIVSKSNVDLFGDKQFLRAKRFADDALKKELDDMVKGRDYLLAIEEMQRAKTGEDYKKVAGMFDKLGDFADAGTKKKEAVYRQAEAALKRANDIAGFLAAKNLFESLGDYLDAKQKVQECERGIASLKDVAERRERQRQKEKEANENYRKEYEQFEKEMAERSDIKELSAKVKSGQIKINSLRAKSTINPIQKQQIFRIGFIGLLFYFLSSLFGALSLIANRSVGELGSMPLAIILRMILAVVIFCGGFVRFFVRKRGNDLLPACIKGVVVLLLVMASMRIPFVAGIVLAIPTLIDGIFNFYKVVRLIGIAALLIAAAMLAMRILAETMRKSRYAEITRLEQGTDAARYDINNMIGTEYQKIYDRYPDVGSNRKSVSEVQNLMKQKLGVQEQPEPVFLGGTGKSWNFPFGKRWGIDKKRLPVGKWMIGLSVAAVLFYVAQFGLVTFMDAPSGWSVLAYAPNILFKEAMVEYTGSPYFISLRPLEKLYIGGGCEKLSKIIAPFGIKQVTLNCGEIKKITIPNSVTDLTLNHLQDEAASEIVLPKDLEILKITDSPELTEEGFAALTIPESVKSLSLGSALYYGGYTIVGDNLKKIDISNDLESLEVYAPGDFLANVNGDVQTLNIFSTGNLAVNVNGDVQKFDIGGEGTFAMHINGYVQSVNFGSGSFSGIENLTVDGTGRIDRMDLGYAGNGLQFNLAPKAMRVFSYSNENELILPEGIEILECGNYKGLQIPGSIRLLRVASDTLDFDALNIPEGILYYKLDSDERDDHREYRAENCPQELADFNFDSEDVTMPDLSGY